MVVDISWFSRGLSLSSAAVIISSANPARLEICEEMDSLLAKKKKIII